MAGFLGIPYLARINQASLCNGTPGPALVAARYPFLPGREIPKDEVQRIAPDLAKAEALFESAPGAFFDPAASGPERSKPREIGNHGHWPMRYRAVYVAWGPKSAPENSPKCR